MLSIVVAITVFAVVVMISLLGNPTHPRSRKVSCDSAMAVTRWSVLFHLRDRLCGCGEKTKCMRESPFVESQRFTCSTRIHLLGVSGGDAVFVIAGVFRRLRFRRQRFRPRTLSVDAGGRCAVVVMIMLAVMVVVLMMMMVVVVVPALARLRPKPPLERVFIFAVSRRRGGGGGSAGGGRRRRRHHRLVKREHRAIVSVRLKAAERDREGGDREYTGRDD